MNNVNGTGKPIAQVAHQGTDQWFAIGDKLAEQLPPTMPDTRELATITAKRGRRAERIGIAAGVLTFAVIALVSLVAHRRSGASSAPQAAVMLVAPPVAAAAPPVDALAPPVAAPAAAITAPATPRSSARAKHRKTTHRSSASHHR